MSEPNSLAADAHAVTGEINRSWTVVGLALALFSLPLITTAYRQIVGANQEPVTYVMRELTIFITLAFLLWIVRRGEGLSFESLGLRATAVGRSLLWGLLGAVLCALALAISLALISVLKLRFGGEGGGHFSPPVWAMLITVVRASVVEEVFYRGYAIDRLQRLTGNTPVAVGLALLVFAAAHYRQGSGGVLIALLMGAVLTALFLKKRDLLALITAHFIVDFIPNIVLPLISA